MLFRHPKRTRVALNIGGIANISLIPAKAKPEDVIAFDTGPGNMAIDALVAEFSKGKQLFDVRTARSRRKAMWIANCSTSYWADRYYQTKPPKSAGREQYGAEFVASLKASGGSRLPDLIATATALTAATIAMGVNLAGKPDEIIAFGRRRPQSAVDGATWPRCFRI